MRKALVALALALGCLLALDSTCQAQTYVDSRTRGLGIFRRPRVSPFFRPRYDPRFAWGWGGYDPRFAWGWGGGWGGYDPRFSLWAYGNPYGYGSWPYGYGGGWDGYPWWY